MTRRIGSILPVVMIVALVVGGVLRAVLGRLPGALVTGGAVSHRRLDAGRRDLRRADRRGDAHSCSRCWAAAWAGAVVQGGGLRGGGFGGGGFGGGGFGGGGFSGGGGGFGGGGASGRW